MVKIYFSNSALKYNPLDRVCHCEMLTGYSVFDALCLKYLHVTMVSDCGEVMREYNNCF